MTDSAVVEALLDRYGRTFADELHIPIAKNTPSALFCLLCATVLFSHRIHAGIAVAASQALHRQGWTTAQRLADSTWRERTDVLNASGFARYDESTSRLLGDCADMALERYRGDLRRLRARADRDPAEERRLIDEFPGIGPTGVDIFSREAQVAWPELGPFIDARARRAAVRLELEPESLVRGRTTAEVARLAAALIRVDLDDGYDTVRATARARL